jgi:hypothetical protein
MLVYIRAVCTAAWVRFASTDWNGRAPLPGGPGRPRPRARGAPAGGLLRARPGPAGNCDRPRRRRLRVGRPGLPASPTLGRGPSLAALSSTLDAVEAQAGSLSRRVRVEGRRAGPQCRTEWAGRAFESPSRALFDPPPAGAASGCHSVTAQYQLASGFFEPGSLQAQP